jgi:hypothetical protein
LLSSSVHGKLREFRVVVSQCPLHLLSLLAFFLRQLHLAQEQHIYLLHNGGLQIV